MLTARSTRCAVRTTSYTPRADRRRPCRTGATEPVRRAHEAGASLQVIAEVLGVHRTYVHQIVKAD
jgi:hypothetical protein